MVSLKNSVVNRKDRGGKTGRIEGKRMACNIGD
jgi:hypothetical protein